MKVVDLQVDDGDEETMKKKEEAIKELEKKKKINELEHEEMAKSEHYGMLLLDDLKFNAVARYKLYKYGDWEKGDLIKDALCRKRSVRKAVLDEDISDLSKIEENFNERDVRIKAGEMKPRKERAKKAIGEKSSSSSSDAMSSFDSEASRVNFWKDINTKDDIYRQAIVITKDDKDKEKGKFKENEVGVGIAGSPVQSRNNVHEIAEKRTSHTQQQTQNTNKERTDVLETQNQKIQML